MLRLIRRSRKRVAELAYQAGFMRQPTWSSLSRKAGIFLYAGDLPRDRPQYRTHYGISPYRRARRNIKHDVRQPIPLGEGTVWIFQSEDVFEHISYPLLPGIFEEVYRVLKPGGLFRLSVPDYRCDVYRERALRRDDGSIIFDPGGGGRLQNGVVVEGGHLWFPVLEAVESLFRRSSFARYGSYRVLHGTRPDGSSILETINHGLGMVQRTPDFDKRAMSPTRPLSIVVDAWKGTPDETVVLKALQNACKRRDAGG